MRTNLPRSHSRCKAPVLAFLLLGLGFLGAAPWPAWRGPAGTGVCLETNLPLHWSATENVRWKAPLPEPGQSTPVVWGERIFVSQAVEKGNRRTLLCFDRADGALRWQVGVAYAGDEPSHPSNPRCSSSPVTDGERVIVWFGSAGLYCYDFEGRELWHRDLGEQRHIWGNASSPVLHGDVCYLNFGPGQRTFLIAVDKRTGKTRWHVDEPGGDSGEERPGRDKPPWIGSWSTPILIQSGNREELVLSWPKRVAAFDPQTGKEFWTCSGLNPLVYTSPIYQDGIVVGMGGYGGMALAVRAGGAGDVTETRRLWHHPKTKQRIGSAVIAGQSIFILDDPGVAECIDLKTGRRLWEERLMGKSARNSSWSSMVLAGDRIYVVNQSGDTFILRASPTFEVLATNSLAETTMASIAPSDGNLFIRTHRHLWCIGPGGTHD
jgi:outer membrane protein assembly factor BamB